MSTSPHTPGPWPLFFEPIGSDPEIPVPYARIRLGGGFWDEETNSGGNIAAVISEGDARLISAAPEMAQAIRAAVSSGANSHRPGAGSDDVVIARTAFEGLVAALAKAGDAA